MDSNPREILQFFDYLTGQVSFPSASGTLLQDDPSRVALLLSTSGTSAVTFSTTLQGRDITLAILTQSFCYAELSHKSLGALISGPIKYQSAAPGGGAFATSVSFRFDEYMQFVKKMRQ